MADDLIDLLLNAVEQDFLTQALAVDAGRFKDQACFEFMFFFVSLAHRVASLIFRD